MTGSNGIAATAPKEGNISGDLAGIASEGLFLWERLAVSDFKSEPARSELSTTEQRIKEWRTVLGDEDLDALERRLDWDGIELPYLRERMSGFSSQSPGIQPAWMRTVGEIVAKSRVRDPRRPFSHTGPRIPFEEVLAPIVVIARGRLAGRLRTGDGWSCCQPVAAILSRSGRRALERSLLVQLSEIAAPALHQEFSKRVPDGRKLLHLLKIDPPASGERAAYLAFVRDMRGDALVSFFGTYPVLARLAATLVDSWVETSAEFLTRLARDLDAIAELLQTQPSTHAGSGPREHLGPVINVQCGISDRHRGGRTVFVLAFQSGAHLVYKPRDLAVEVEFGSLLAWCNAQGGSLDLRAPRVLLRKGYGWVEHMAHTSCVDFAAVDRFYQRTGMLLAVLHALRATDCHFENVIAVGEHPVLVDAETLLHAEAWSLDEPESKPPAGESASHALDGSVLRTGLLPRWEFSSNHAVAYVVSALGSTLDVLATVPTARWKMPNTDDMRLEYEVGDAPIDHHRPTFFGRSIDASGQVAQITSGFREMYCLLQARRHKLLAPDGPLQALALTQTRFVFRPTRVYAAMLQSCSDPTVLRSGVDFSIQLDRLACAFLVAPRRPAAWQILAAEQRALMRMDVPLFTAGVSSTSLDPGDGPEIPDVLRISGINGAERLIRGMSEDDLRRQVAVIEAAFHARTAQGNHRVESANPCSPGPEASITAVLSAAGAIAEALAATAFVEDDGGASWLGMSYVDGANRYQLRALDDGLYDGRCGVALFLAAYYRITGNSVWSALARRALWPLRQRIRACNAAARRRTLGLVGLGGGSGLGSMIYALVKVGQILSDPSFADDAAALAAWITDEAIAQDRDFDVMGGCAGALLGLLALHEATGQAQALVAAQSCGRHLVASRVGEAGAAAWPCRTGRPLTGFSHGAAGISLALLRLQSTTSDAKCRAAAHEGIAFERRLFSAQDGNWPDEAPESIGDIPPPMRVQWCRGAPGITLARLGGLSYDHTPELRAEIDCGLRTTRDVGLQSVDHLCCGNFGRIEVLLVAAERLGEGLWRKAALAQTEQVLQRAAQSGGFRYFTDLPPSVSNPGFFQGSTGVGYGLLRLVDSTLPSVLLWQ